MPRVLARGESSTPGVSSPALCWCSPQPISAQWSVRDLTTFPRDAAVGVDIEVVSFFELVLW